MMLGALAEADRPVRCVRRTARIYVAMSVVVLVFGLAVADPPRSERASSCCCPLRPSFCVPPWSCVVGHERDARPGLRALSGRRVPRPHLLRRCARHPGNLTASTSSRAARERSGLGPQFVPRVRSPVWVAYGRARVATDPHVAPSRRAPTHTRPRTSPLVSLSAVSAKAGIGGSCVGPSASDGAGGRAVRSAAGCSRVRQLSVKRVAASCCACH